MCKWVRPIRPRSAFKCIIYTRKAAEDATQESTRRRRSYRARRLHSYLWRRRRAWDTNTLMLTHRFSRHITHDDSLCRLPPQSEAWRELSGMWALDWERRLHTDKTKAWRVTSGRLYMCACQLCAFTKTKQPSQTSLIFFFIKGLGIEHGRAEQSRRREIKIEEESCKPNYVLPLVCLNAVRLCGAPTSTLPFCTYFECLFLPLPLLLLLTF